MRSQPPEVEGESDSAHVDDDGIERWGRRVGRALAWLGVALLLIHLVWTYG
jgi:hypothetical protein